MAAGHARPNPPPQHGGGTGDFAIAVNNEQDNTGLSHGRNTDETWWALNEYVVISSIIFVLLLIALIAFLCWRRRRHRVNSRPSKEQIEMKPTACKSDKVPDQTVECIIVA